MCVVVLVVVVEAVVVVVVDDVVVGTVVAGVAIVVGSSSCTDWNVCRRMLSVVVLVVLDVLSGTREDDAAG